jgi:probable F420-dependent oxidoreductase
MRIGGAMFFTDYSMSPTELARALEERGFDSLWVPEHSHIPLTRKSPFPSGGDLPKKYYDVMDPFVVLGAAAAVTKTLLLGTGICLIAQRDPIQTAKQVASIDQVSGGRFLFGIGNGWNEDEMANHGTVFASRHKLARERVEAMKEIWTASKAEYHGEFVNFDPMMTWPKPVQKPHPPIIVGGAFPFGARRALRYGDGWMPHRTRSQYADVQALLPKFREMAAEAGRDPASVPITIWGAKENLDLLKRDRDDGVSRLVVSLDSGKADTILPELDRWATLIRQPTAESRRVARPRPGTSACPRALHRLSNRRNRNRGCRRPCRAAPGYRRRPAPPDRQTGGARHHWPVVAQSRRTP